MTDGGSALNASYGVQVEYAAHLLQCAIHFLKNAITHAKRHNEIFKESTFWALQKSETAGRFNGILAEPNAPRTLQIFEKACEGAKNEAAGRRNRHDVVQKSEREST